MYADTFSIPLSVPANLVVNTWSVSPNPANDFISVNGTAGENVEFQLFDLTGNLVLSQQVNSGQQVSVAGLPAGVYLCVIRNEETTFSTQKISVTR
jgi:hypothetical protein